MAGRWRRSKCRNGLLLTASLQIFHYRKREEEGEPAMEGVESDFFCTALCLPSKPGGVQKIQGFLISEASTFIPAAVILL